MTLPPCGHGCGGFVVRVHEETKCVNCGWILYEPDPHTLMRRDIPDEWKKKDQAAA